MTRSGVLFCTLLMQTDLLAGRSGRQVFQDTSTTNACGWRPGADDCLDLSVWTRRSPAEGEAQIADVSTWRSMRRRAGENWRLAITARAPAKAVAVWTDADRLAQVFIKLIVSTGRTMRRERRS